ncbi:MULTISPECIES: NERD domain-containing protein [unclassified Marinobacterium]|uniref:NERD domain-containing protein n=1 Tax=unclassified Marinobacterium TaxID=2644139 RepID=UPI00156966FF|nr:MULTISPECIES: NERD domain-containing protein [unclassified Marinobacterium]NRP10366.1 DNA topoisomerase I [Marinobacterium sp. xm-g-48]NRP83465.1 DNA topoisomerase I [Marinobacterium sp. xm-d-509]
MNNFIVAIVVLAALYLLKFYLTSPSVIGARGEKKVATKNRKWLNSDVYQSFDDLVVPTDEGTTQIDHVILSKFGIFVLETKHYQGWIFGNANQPYWTQKIYKKSSKFQNPLRQNYKHVKALSEYLGVSGSLLKSVVVFSARDCELKSDMPSNVRTVSDYIEYIRGFTQAVVSDEDMAEIKSKLTSLSLSSTKESKRDHLDNLRKKDALAASGVCPRCGGDLVKRAVRNGINQGRSFLGCENFPKCRFTKSL